LRDCFAQCGVKRLFFHFEFAVSHG
jgi:hypothetical protein